VARHQYLPDQCRIPGIKARQPQRVIGPQGQGPAR
jgi:hypothetical protein